MKKIVIYIVSVFFGVICIDFLLAVTMEKIMPETSTGTLFESPNNISSDLYILGASRAIRHYNPKIISDSLNCSVGVYGGLAQNIFFHYAVFDCLLEHAKKKPKTVLLEVANIDINDTPSHNTERLHFLFPYYFTEVAVKNMLDDVLENKELFMVRHSALYRYNSKILLYIGRAFEGKQKPTVLGYTPLKNVWKKPIKEGPAEEKISIISQKREYLVKLINKCKREKIKLVFAYSPRYLIVHEQDWAEIKKIARLYDIPFIDYDQDSLFLKHGEWFNDANHLNEEGANIYSKIIADELKRIMASH